MNQGMVSCSLHAQEGRALLCLDIGGSACFISYDMRASGRCLNRRVSRTCTCTKLTYSTDSVVHVDMSTCTTEYDCNTRHAWRRQISGSPQDHKLTSLLIEHNIDQLFHLFHLFVIIQTTCTASTDLFLPSLSLNAGPSRGS